MSIAPSIAGYVYLITNLVNGKKYVGCTVRTLKARWSEHCKNARKGSPFVIHAAMRKYGVESFAIEALRPSPERVVI